MKNSILALVALATAVLVSLSPAAAAGKTLVAEGVRRTVEAWPGRGIRISAQTHLARFYAAFGFDTVGEPYAEDNIPHVQMHRRP